MKNTAYESPKYTFEELALTERVANRCFGNAHIWVDLDNDHQQSPDEPSIPLPNGCKGAAAAAALNEWIQDHGYGNDYPTFGADVCNTKDSGLGPVAS